MLFSEPKIPQYTSVRLLLRRGKSFSALQRAENSSIRKRRARLLRAIRFSALQRAENSSICDHPPGNELPLPVSVLFSEPKIPQWSRCDLKRCVIFSFSALQRAENSSILVSKWVRKPVRRFSALQRAENSSIVSRLLTTL